MWRHDTVLQSELCLSATCRCGPKLRVLSWLHRQGKDARPAVSLPGLPGTLAAAPPGPHSWGRDPPVAAPLSPALAHPQWFDPTGPDEVPQWLRWSPGDLPKAQALSGRHAPDVAAEMAALTGTVLHGHPARATWPGACGVQDMTRCPMCGATVRSLTREAGGRWSLSCGDWITEEQAAPILAARGDDT